MVEKVVCCLKDRLLSLRIGRASAPGIELISQGLKRFLAQSLLRNMAFFPGAGSLLGGPPHAVSRSFRPHAV